MSKKMMTGINNAVAAALRGGATGIMVDVNGKYEATVSTATGKVYVVSVKH